MGRINFKTIISRYQQAGKPNVRLTQSDLYLTQAINANKTVYNFDVLETQNSTLQANELRLNLNDEFIISKMCIGLEATVTTGGVTYGKKRFQYAPTELDARAAILNPTFDGAVQISVNNIVYLDKWSTRKSEKVTRTEFSSLANATSIPSYDGSNDGIIDMEPLITLSGAKKNTITLTLPSAIGTVALAGKDQQSTPATTTYTIDRVFVWLSGLNAQNAASFQQ